MESSLLNDPSFCPSNQIKNSKRKTYYHNHHHHRNHYQQQQAARLSNIWRQSSCGNSIAPPPPPHVQLEMVHGATRGMFLNYFPSSNNNQFHLSTSLPPILPSQHHHYHHQQQPPLLPLPVVSKPTFHSLPALTRRTSLSSPIPRKQVNQKVVKLPAAPTNNKRPTTYNNTHQKSKKENTYNNNNNNNNNNGLLLAENNGIVGSTKGMGPDPVIYPKEVNRVKMMDYLKKEGTSDDDVNKFIASSVVFCLSPPPSSLPLPKFSLRQVQQNKISCKAEAAVDEVEAGAVTDNLCRLLKLR